jgi:hypothetical protein
MSPMGLVTTSPSSISRLARPRCRFRSVGFLGALSSTIRPASSIERFRLYECRGLYSGNPHVNFVADKLEYSRHVALGQIGEAPQGGAPALTNHVVGRRPWIQ